MKKILSIIAISATAWATAQAGPPDVDFTMMNFPGVFAWQDYITLSDGTTKVNTLGDSYIAAYWWSPDDSPGSYKALGATVFSDANFLSDDWPAGGALFFQSDMVLPYTTNGQTGYIQMRIFQYNMVDTSLWSDTDWTGFTDSLWVTDLSNATQQKNINDLWAFAKTNSEEIYEGKAMFTTDINGVVPDGGFLTWSKDPLQLYKNPTYDPIPEPSTWLLLGAGAAFAVVMRRRKK